MREPDYYIDGECEYCVGTGYGSGCNSWGDPLPCDLCDGTGRKVDLHLKDFWDEEYFSRTFKL